MVPFDPPLIFGVGGQLYFPWFSFWRQNPLANEALSLFVTLVDEILMQDPDLENARFQILDFSAMDGKRSLTVIDSEFIPRISDDRKAEMLTTFASGYALAVEELAARGKANKKRPTSEDRPSVASNQLGLFEE